MAVSRGEGGIEEKKNLERILDPEQMVSLKRKKRKEIYSCRSNINSRLNFTFESGLKGCSRELLIFSFFCVLIEF